MNYLQITHEDVCNGNGLRVVLWLSACSHHCHNCQNPQTWNPDSGILFDEAAKQEIFDELSKDYISGITLSGGDPLHEQNLDGVLDLIKEIRLSFPEKSIWLYTGYTWEKIMNDFENSKRWLQASWKHSAITRYEIIKNVDILVDGEYIDEQRNLSKKWAGSDNQRCVDVKQSLTQGKVVLYCD